MELKRLKYFIACAEELHFTRAAARLGIAQPPLSQQIQLLESELGMQLFWRLARGVQLTPAGESLFRDVKHALELVDHAIVSAQKINRGEQGSIRIGFTSSASFNPFVPNTISKFASKYPGAEISLYENATSRSLEDLREGRLDVAFLRPAHDELDRIRCHTIFNERTVGALPRHHRLAEKAKLTLRDFASQPFILYPRSNGRALYDEIIAACKKAGFSPNIVQEAPQMASLINFVAAGLGVSIVPESMSNLHVGDVVYRSFEGAFPKATLKLVYGERSPSKLTGNFVDFVKRAAARHEAPPRVTAGTNIAH